MSVPQEPTQPHNPEEIVAQEDSSTPVPTPPPPVPPVTEPPASETLAAAPVAEPAAAPEAEPAAAPAAEPAAAPVAPITPTPPAPLVAPAPPAPSPAGLGTGPATGHGSAEAWGRVADDGTVFVRTAEGERSVGQYPEGTPEEALKFFTDRYDALAFEVSLLEQRISGGSLSPEEATTSIKTVRSQVSGANAVGDLAALEARLDALNPVIASQREQRRAERAAKVAESKVAKEAIVSEAEKLATGNDWRNGANRLRALLDEWKALPRLDRPSDDALWRRFSTARTAYTRRRKAHFAEQHEKRDVARTIKERLATEAEALADSTEWGPTSGRYRDLMREWKAAGPAPREVDDALWQRFRGAQDKFFGARDAANAELDREFSANAEAKEAILVEAEALVPVQDLEATKRTFRELADRWDAAGKVPRERIKELEGRMRKVEQAIKSVEDEQWKRSDPEKSARADDMVGKLEDAIAKVERDLAKARAGGDPKKVKELEDNLASRQAFLEMAKRAAADFS